MMRSALAGAMAVLTAACSLPSPRENVEAVSQLVRSNARASLEWRRTAADDQAARARAAALIDDGVTLEDAVGAAFLLSPVLQVQLEELAIVRADLLAAMTPPNPVGVAGSRKPGGDLAVFYPERSISIGVLVNVIALLSMPDRVAVARGDLDRARLEAAQQAVTYAVKVVQAWLEYSAALQIHPLNERTVLSRRAALDAASSRPPGTAGRDEAVLLARAALVRPVDDAIRSELLVATTRARLAELMGTTGWRDDWKLAVSLPAPPAADPDPVALESAAMRQRLDLQAAAAEVEVRLRALSMQKRFRWITQLDLGVFREKALGGTSFTGPNAVVEIPVFDQRLALVLKTDARLAIAMRKLEAAQQAVRTDVQVKVAELRAIRRQLQQVDPGALAPEDEAIHVGMVREYWRARSALAFAAGDWASLSGLQAAPAATGTVTN